MFCSVQNYLSFTGLTGLSVLYWILSHFLSYTRLYDPQGFMSCYFLFTKSSKNYFLKIYCFQKINLKFKNCAIVNPAHQPHICKHSTQFSIQSIHVHFIFISKMCYLNTERVPISIWSIELLLNEKLIPLHSFVLESYFNSFDLQCIQKYKN